MAASKTTNITSTRRTGITVTAPKTKAGASLRSAAYSAASVWLCVVYDTWVDMLCGRMVCACRSVLVGGRQCACMVCAAYGMSRLYDDSQAFMDSIGLSQVLFGPPTTDCLCFVVHDM